MQIAAGLHRIGSGPHSSIVNSYLVVTDDGVTVVAKGEDLERFVP